MKKIILFLFVFSLPAFASVGDLVDCSSAYQDLAEPVSCKVIVCDKKYESFLGTWEGPFEAYDQKANLYRPLRNQVKYSEDECLENIEADHAGYGDTFIIGRKIDIYPPFKELKGKTDISLLVTGKHKNGEPFLRTISPLSERTDPQESFVEYQLETQDSKTSTSVWSVIFKNSYEDHCGEKESDKVCKYDLKFTVTDGRRMSDLKTDTRDVTVKMEMFLSPTGEKVMEKITNRGHHSKVR